jgi:ribosomal protein S6--L-glutamate ligase
MPPGSLEQVVFRMDVLGRLQAAGVPVINPPRSIECAVDKFLTTARLEAAGLPVPRTVTCQDSETAMQAFESLGGDVVVKPLFGAEGRGICRVSDPDLAFRTFRTLERIDAVLYLQEFMHHPGHDVRVLVLGGEITGSMRRYADDDFRTNVAVSGRAEPHAATLDEQRIALAAADAVGTHFAGIDLLYDQSGRCYVIEVNAVPGWQAFQRTTGIDVARHFVDWVAQHHADCR